MGARAKLSRVYTFYLADHAGRTDCSLTEHEDLDRCVARLGLVLVAPVSRARHADHDAPLLGAQLSELRACVEHGVLLLAVDVADGLLGEACTRRRQGSQLRRSVRRAVQTRSGRTGIRRRKTSHWPRHMVGRPRSSPRRPDRAAQTATTCGDGGRGVVGRASLTPQHTQAKKWHKQRLSRKRHFFLLLRFLL